MTSGELHHLKIQPLASTVFVAFSFYSHCLAMFFQQLIALHPFSMGI